MRAFSRLIKRLLFAMSLNSERTKVESGKEKERKATKIREMDGKRGRKRETNCGKREWKLVEQRQLEKRLLT